MASHLAYLSNILSHQLRVGKNNSDFTKKFDNSTKRADISPKNKTLVSFS